MRSDSGAELKAILVVAALAAMLGGCASSGSSGIDLPDLTRIPQKLLTKDEQQRAVQDLSADKVRQQADAVKQIEQTK
jgi:hypothetical protein